MGKQIPLSEYKIQPVVVVDFVLVLDAAKGVPGAFDISEIEECLQGYRSSNFLVGGVHNRPTVGRSEETEPRYIAEVQHALSKFKSNPFHWVKASYYDQEHGTHPFCRRSFLTLPDIGMLVLVEAEAWGMGVSTDWGSSIVIGLSQEMQEFAKRGHLQFMKATSAFDPGEPEVP